jgi:hypothetical protein
MNTYEALVMVSGSGLVPNGIPTRLTFQCRNMAEAREYFSKFGSIIQGPRQI